MQKKIARDAGATDTPPMARYDEDQLGREVRASRRRLLGVGCIGLIVLSCVGLYIWVSFSDRPTPNGPWVTVSTPTTLSFNLRPLESSVASFQRDIVLQGRATPMPDFLGGLPWMNLYWIEARGETFARIVDTNGDYLVNINTSEVGRLGRCGDQDWWVVGLERESASTECTASGIPELPHRAVPVQERGEYIGRLEIVNREPVFLAREQAEEVEVITVDL